MALVSRAFKGDPKLEACAVSDPAHITPGSVGAHVGKIQAALVDLDGARIEAGELAGPRYGGTTASSVAAFKTARNILNFQGRIDNIVGKKTIAALDRELKVREGSLPVPPTPPAAPIGDAEQARFARVQALQAVSVVEHHINYFRFAVATGMPRDLQSAAFNNHFKLVVNASEAAAHRPRTKVFNPSADHSFLPVIRANFVKLARVLSDDSKWRMITEAEARREGAVVGDPTTPAAQRPVAAAYTVGVGNHVRITPAFNRPARGPFCQVAIVLHEALHVIDGLSGRDGVTHISEWATIDPPINGKFTDKTSYDRQSPENAVHNPSAYASFAIHLFRGADERFGDGRRTE